MAQKNDAPKEMEPPAESAGHNQNPTYPPLPFFYTRSRPKDPSGTKSWTALAKAHLREWLEKHF